MKKKTNRTKRVTPKGTSRAKKTRAQARPPKKRTASARRTNSKFFVRISGTGQFAVSKNTIGKLNKLDNNIVALLKRDQDGTSEGKFREVVSKMVSIVKKEGKPLPHEQIVPSHAIIPDERVTLEEARRIFSEEGSVPEHLVF